MIGNSSSGLVEAASFKLPVVNIGDRQKGRLSSENVISVPCERVAITEAITCATSEAFRQSLTDLVNPYGDGRAAEKMIKVLSEVSLDEGLIQKSFIDSVHANLGP